MEFIKQFSAPTQKSMEKQGDAMWEHPPSPPGDSAETVAVGTQVRFHPPGKGSSAEKATEEGETFDDSSGLQASVKTMKGTRRP